MNTLITNCFLCVEALHVLSPMENNFIFSSRRCSLLGGGDISTEQAMDCKSLFIPHVPNEPFGYLEPSFPKPCPEID